MLVTSSGFTHAETSIPSKNAKSCVSGSRPVATNFTSLDLMNGMYGLDTALTPLSTEDAP